MRARDWEGNTHSIGFREVSGVLRDMGKGRIFVSYFQLRKLVGVGRRLPANVLPIFSFLGRN